MSGRFVCVFCMFFDGITIKRGAWEGKITKKSIIKKIKKRDGRIVDFDEQKIFNAIWKAAQAVGGKDKSIAEKLAAKVVKQLEKFYKDTIPSVEDVQDIVEKILIEEGHAKTAKAYILYRQERRRIREEKKRILEKDSLDEIDKAFDVNSLRVLAARYLARDENGKLIEGPKQLFERVATLVVIPDLMRDSEIYSREARQLKPEEVEQIIEEVQHYMNKLDEYDKVLSIQQYKLNKWHFEALLRFYKEHAIAGHMKVNIKRIIELFQQGYFDKYVEQLEKYFWLMAKRDFMPNSPTLMCGATKLGQLSACFVLPMHDDMEEIMKTASYAAYIFKSGGGVGINYSELRPKGDIVASTYGIASGPISFMRIIDVLTDVIKQGGRRRGANMAVLEAWHPQIEEFITMKQQPGVFENFNVSVMLDETFMKALQSNDDGEYALINPRTKQKVGSINSKQLFELIAFSAWKSAEPGVLFLHNINKYNVLIPAKGLIRATNPCVTGDTLIITNKGLIPASKLKENNPNISVMTQDGWNKIEAIYNNGIRDVYKIKLKNGIEIKVTPEHKFYTKDGWKEAKEINENDKVLIILKDFEINNKFENPSEIDDIKFAELLGVFIGDGSVSKTDHVSFHVGCDENLSNYIFEILKDHGAFKFKRGKQWIIDVHRKNFANMFRKIIKGNVSNSRKKFVPEIILKSNSKIMAAFLRGLFSADGSVYNAKGTPTIALSSSSKQLLNVVQQMLIALGIYSILTKEKKAEIKKIKGKKYKSSATWRIIINGYYAKKFAEKIGLIGKKSDKLKKILKKKRFYKKNKEFVEIVEKKRAGKEIVYDITAKPSYTWITNGIYSLDCGEQPLYEYESCNLGSINLANFTAYKDGKVVFDWQRYEQVVRLATRFLDNIIDINKYPVKEIDKASKETRKIGLGIMGLADLLFKLEIPYNSKEGFELMNYIAEGLSYFSMDESVNLAIERGAFPLYEKTDYPKGKLPVAGYYELPKSMHCFDWDKLIERIKQHGIRNAMTTTIAPTGSISMIAGTSNGIEPIFALVYEKHVSVGKFYYIDPVFEAKLKQLDMYNDEILEKIARNYGSIKGLQEFDKKLQQVFVTAMSMHWADHVMAQAIWQRWISASISKTINMPNDVTVEDVKNAYLMAYALGLKGITVFRDGSRGRQVLHITSDVKEKLYDVKPSEFTLKQIAKIDNSYIRQHLAKMLAHYNINLDEIRKQVESEKKGEKQESMKPTHEKVETMPTAESKNTNPAHVIEESETMEKVMQHEIEQQSEAVISNLPEINTELGQINFELTPEARTNIVSIQTQQQMQQTQQDERTCPICGGLVIFEGGCNKCIECGWSECTIS